MLKISEIKIEGLREGCITDVRPRIAFALESDHEGESLYKAIIRSGSWCVETSDQINTIYGGDFEPHSEYTIHIEAFGSSGEFAEAHASFRTGHLNQAWDAKWITDLSYQTPDKLSPIPMVFKREFMLAKPLRNAWIEVSALGVYTADLNGKQVGNDYFMPGFTSYEKQIQYQTYDILSTLKKSNTLFVTIAGGWAVGSFNYKRKSKIYADRQALLCEIHLEYEDGSHEVISSDENWQVTQEGPVRFAEWYDGEIYDANINLNQVHWKNVGITKPRKSPRLLAHYGAPVRRQETLSPISMFTSPSGELIYDFGQNFAGVIAAEIHGSKRQVVTFRHAEVLFENELFVKSLRTAKASAIYHCIDGKQFYSPRLTYMGFRYVGVSGIDAQALDLKAYVLHSDLEETGSFTCSNPLLNQLQSNIRWGGKSNFVDIPTDCPQRDERQGWTGDLAVFARTASFNFDMSRFLEKWLIDLRSEQGSGGGYPMVVPKAGDVWPTMATSAWGDVSILAPWAEYLARGNVHLLRAHYPSMKRFIQAAQWWSKLLSFSKDTRKIWKYPFHFGDWCAPDESAKEWMAKGPWVATAYLANSCRIMSEIATILGEQDDVKHYQNIRNEIVQAYRNVFTDGKGTLKKAFQTAYVLPLAFDMTHGNETSVMAKHLADLVHEADDHLTTGFTGTPYLLFALSDHGYLDVAYRVLLQETCPSWLYEVKAGGTTIWERWDALRPDGSVNIKDLHSKKEEDSGGGMVSFNHYANGAVGDWLYRRVLGLETTSGGYKDFIIHPRLGGNLTHASGHIKTAYGLIQVAWKIIDQQFEIDVQVPVSTTGTLILPTGETHILKSGRHHVRCPLERSL